MAPLDGAKLKIVRAQKHLECLKAEIGAYLDAKPYTFPLQVDMRFIGTGSALSTHEPPLELGCIFGDCLNNLRASLDYIAWELATKYAPAEETARKNAIHFPLQKRATDFATNARANLKKLGFPAPAIDLIESVQPYHTGYESLGLLNELVNRDKHRLPLLTIANVETDRITVKLGPVTIGLIATATPSGPLAAHVDPDSADGIAAREAFERIARQAASPGTSSHRPEDVKVDGEASVFVSLKDSTVPLEPVDVMLTKIFKCVSDIVPRFEPFVT